jgi:hypothetical protein
VTVKHFTHQLIALGLALNYALFQIEPFEEEYEAQHPVTSGVLSYSIPALNWESFDKENAPKAFTFHIVHAPVALQFFYPALPFLWTVSHTPFQPLRDKSPPTA